MNFKEHSKESGNLRRQGSKSSRFGEGLVIETEKGMLELNRDENPCSKENLSTLNSALLKALEVDLV